MICYQKTKLCVCGITLIKINIRGMKLRIIWILIGLSLASFTPDFLISPIFTPFQSVVNKVGIKLSL